MEQQVDGTFRLHRMLPPKQIRYFYTFAGKPAIAENLPTLQLKQTCKQVIELLDDKTANVELAAVNFIRPKPDGNLLDLRS